MILSSDPALEGNKTEQDKDEMLDAKSIFIYKSIKSINPTLQILTELSYSSNIEFLQPR